MNGDKRFYWTALIWLIGAYANSFLTGDRLRVHHVAVAYVHGTLVIVCLGLAFVYYRKARA